MGGKITHGHTMAYSATYNTWASMRARCLGKNHRKYKDYGARGISICDRWQSFSNFLEDMGERPSGCTIDRIDNLKGYTPENCRWSDIKTQNRNRACVIKLKICCQEKTLKEWSEIYGIPYKSIYTRYAKGYPLRMIFNHKLYKPGSRPTEAN